MTRPTWIVCALAAALAAPALGQGEQPAQQQPAQQQPAQQQGGQQPPAQPPAQQGAPGQAPAAKPAPAADRLYVDEDYNFRVASPSGWARTNPAGIALPGEVIRAWSPDGSMWIAIYRLVPNGPVSPRGMTTTSADALKNSLGAEIASQEVRDLAGMKVMWIVANGKGTGTALDGKGTVATSQHWVGIPRSDDVLVFLLTAPQASFPQADRTFEDMLRTLQVGGTQTEGQRSAT